MEHELIISVMTAVLSMIAMAASIIFIEKLKDKIKEKRDKKIIEEEVCMDDEEEEN